MQVNSNKVYIFQRTNDNTTYNHAQTLDAPVNLYTGDGKFGTGLDISPDAKWIVIGAPNMLQRKNKIPKAHLQVM